MQHIYLLLHNIRSAHNVGSILRTADAARVTKVFMCGCTPTPIDRFGRKRRDVAKVALGAEVNIPWEYREDITEVITELQKKKVRVVAVEQDIASIPYTEFKNDTATAFILGEETKGISKDILTLCDSIIEIPMKGKKESLNVSVATGIVLFRFVE
jgi:tRNA G18 (ribose-2'-O)-methylase SpoU